MRFFSAPDIDFAGIRTELGITEDYGDQALAEAADAVDSCAADREDLRHLPFVTIDPPTSRDLDQAVYLQTRPDGGFTVNYAIADVGALVVPGGALDAEARRRGTTFYFPDESVPLHPRVLSEGSGSLLPDVDRPAVVWTMEVAPDGTVGGLGDGGVHVRRALVRSVAKLDYAGVSADAARGALHPSIAALPAFGQLRSRAALARGAIGLDMPAQEVVRDGDGWTIRLARRYDSEDWNEQLSLLTGIVAGTIMRDANVGILRTVPPPSDAAVEQLRAMAATLGASWPDGATIGQFLAAQPADSPTTLALMSAATGLLSGADYLALPAVANDDGTTPYTEHSGLASVYAHVTAPLRRLPDRFATEACLAVAAGRPVPDWVLEALPGLPAQVEESARLASRADRESVDLAEAVVLEKYVGQRFDAVVTRPRRDRRAAEVFVADPPVLAPCEGDPAPGNRLAVTLTQADPAQRRVRFTPVDGAGERSE
ncbi:RNB domain-containing ribonuclease [Gordonia sp. X0973]|uniref:RNB domain-containing ribonuclease n=1 Tax=Gordonia sp. X0973 TaxID=2742602 RepID=UPI000F54C294|nr:RNB domain-containing ribonuclease [Gordonia sp. X0973]QKT07648.1 RNB domain-containing ribonuclease [Gordonia sp. X0973]